MSLWWVNDSGQNMLRGEPAYEAADGVVFRTYQQAMDYADVTGQSFSVWVDDQGNPGDPTNPIRAYNTFILECLYTVPQARDDFNKMFPSLNVAEQTRFTRMLERAPYLSQTHYVEESVLSDRFAHRFNSAGVSILHRRSR